MDLPTVYFIDDSNRHKLSLKGKEHAGISNSKLKRAINFARNKL